MNKKYRGLSIFALIWVNFFAISANAAEIPQLYEEEIPVLSQSRQERVTVLQQAFKDVLIRVSGRGDVDFLPGMNVYLKQASRYVQQFRYRNKSVAMIEPVSGKETKTILWVRFNEKAVNQLLQSQNLPVWGKTRPAVLLWLVVDDGKQRQLISNDSSHQVRNFINQQARVRGLPVRFPLLDLADRANLRISDVWANFEDTIMAASQRYQAEAVLVGRVYRGFSGSWSARWSLYHEGRRKEWQSAHELLASTVTSSIDQSSDFLALRFAQVQTEGDSGRVLIQVNNVKGLAAFNKVQAYLDSLTTVTQIQPYQVMGDGVIFQLMTRSGRLAVEQAIALGDILVAESSSGSLNTTTESNQKNNAPLSKLAPELVYQLIQ